MLSNQELLKLSQSDNKDGCVPFWVSEKLLERMELEIGDDIRLKSTGDSPFVGKHLVVLVI